MAKRQKIKKRPRLAPEATPEAKGFFLLSLGAASLFSLASFAPFAPSDNWLGWVGYLTAFGAEYLFGLSSYLLPAYSFWLGFLFLKEKKLPQRGYEHLYFALLLLSACLLFTAWAEELPDRGALFEGHILTETVAPRLTRYYLGGLPAYFLYADLPWLNLQKVLSPTGVTLISATLFLVSLLLLAQLQLVTAGKAIASLFSFLYKTGKTLFAKPELPKKVILPTFAGLPTPSVKIKLPETPKKAVEPPLADLPRKVLIAKPPAPKEKEAPHKPLVPRSDSSYRLPSPSLLSPPTQKGDLPTLKKDLMRQAAVLEETLKSFGIEAKVGEIHSGPTITSLEVHPSIGVKVQKIKALENDIALNMQAKSIRIVAPIPGKAAVGVEVPALHPQGVNFKEMLLYYQQKHKKLHLPILLGKAINGDWVFSDLTKMPHCLIAGATGSGKSVCVNTIVMSILMNARPDEVKLLMIDPKKVELTQYSKLPHMIAPVITEAHGAYAALQWLVKEMQVRYEILKQLGLRNIGAFNSRRPNTELESSLSIPIPTQMPLIVAIIDEFADLMMVSSADLETPIARIAQMARAVGIHLILATQRPSREVITGIIKANIPTRISFKVASRVNSQIILDDTGAESLLGNGDLLFLPPGSSQLVRAQGAYISDEEINQVIESIASQSPPNYLISSFDAFRSLDQGSSGDDDKEGKDALYDQALTIVLGAKIASTTFLQRKLKIGYARAAGLMDELEANGVIGPQDGSKARKVLSPAMQGDFLDGGEEGEEG